MPLKASLNDLVLSIPSKAEREGLRHRSTESPFHRDDTITETAQFPVNIFLASLSMTTHESIDSWEDWVEWADKEKHTNN